jgi:uncharacterized protein (DUF433 family)
MIVAPIPIDVPLRRDKDKVIRVGNSRVTLQTVIADFHRGASPEEIIHHYPALLLSDVFLVIGYYLQNRAEVDDYVHQQRELGRQVRQQYEVMVPNDELRLRLIRRLEEQSTTPGA